MRGTRVVGDDYGLAVGIIPAYAGNTTRPPWETGAFRDHPRVCGEHSLFLSAHFGSAGSSPRMRGTRVVSVVECTPIGIIPAYAGNTVAMVESRILAQDHPRVCGEHYSSFSFFWVLVGSSPRMRGTPNSTLLSRSSRGIIPAYAGNTIFNHSLGLSYGDHPRVCGEHCARRIPVAIRTGSSPRMRGTLIDEFLNVDTVRIIPAYAGNTPCIVHIQRNLLDHPRVCGEHRAGHGFAETIRGSSPRMRGTQRIHAYVACSERIIPAYAGNTMIKKLPRLTLRDHPRVCGEHLPALYIYKTYQGSSPRMRGTLPTL